MSGESATTDPEVQKMIDHEREQKQFALTAIRSLPGVKDLDATRDNMDGSILANLAKKFIYYAPDSSLPGLKQFQTALEEEVAKRKLDRYFQPSYETHIATLRAAAQKVSSELSAAKLQSPIEQPLDNAEVSQKIQRLPFWHRPLSYMQTPNTSHSSVNTLTQPQAISREPTLAKIQESPISPPSPQLNSPREQRPISTQALENTELTPISLQNFFEPLASPNENEKPGLDAITAGVMENFRIGIHPNFPTDQLPVLANYLFALGIYPDTRRFSSLVTESIRNMESEHLVLSFHKAFRKYQAELEGKTSYSPERGDISFQGLELHQLEVYRFQRAGHELILGGGNDMYGQLTRDTLKKLHFSYPLDEF